MKNTLNDLTNYLFESLERLQYAETTEELEKEVTRSEAVTKVASKIIDNANILLQAQKHADEYGYNKNKTMPELITGGENKNEQKQVARKRGGVFKE